MCKIEKVGFRCAKWKNLCTNWCNCSKGHNLQPQKEHNFKGLFAKIAIEGFYIPNEKILQEVAVFLDY